MKNFTRYRIIEILKLLSDSILPIIFWVSLIFGFDTPYIAILTVISAILHELGHCMAIHLLGAGESELRGHSSGFRIKRSDALPYKKEIIILLSGPLVNICIFLITFPFRDALYGYIGALGFINLITGLSNLMPFEGYDGYGALCEALRCIGREEMIDRLEILSFVLSILVTFLSLYLIERFGEGYWIFGLFFFTVLSKLAILGKYDIFGE